MSCAKAEAFRSLHQSNPSFAPVGAEKEKNQEKVHALIDKEPITKSYFLDSWASIALRELYRSECLSCFVQIYKGEICKNGRNGYGQMLVSWGQIDMYKKAPECESASSLCKKHHGNGRMPQMQRWLALGQTKGCLGWDNMYKVVILTDRFKHRRKHVCCFGRRGSGGVIELRQMFWTGSRSDEASCAAVLWNRQLGGSNMYAASMAFLRILVRPRYSGKRIWPFEFHHQVMVRKMNVIIPNERQHWWDYSAARTRPFQLALQSISCRTFHYVDRGSIHGMGHVRKCTFIPHDVRKKWRGLCLNCGEARK